MTPTANDSAGIILTSDEATVTAKLAQRIAGEFPSAEDPGLLRELPFLAQELPERVRRYLRRFALDELDGYCVIGGHLVDDERIGPTPGHWKGRQRPGPEFGEEIPLLLYGALLGEPFGWATQQDGHFVNDVFPVREYEKERLGTGSKTPLTLHTEDAFHPYRADYIILSSLRNPYNAVTTIAELDTAEFSDADLRILFDERFVVVPDTSHLPKNNTVRDENERAYFEGIEQLMSGTRYVSILFGSRSAPFLRFDETHMRPADDDPEAERVFIAVAKYLVNNRRPCSLATGDLLIMNNHRVVHGREPFSARYDGTDRWLKRVNVTTDLRKSSNMRGRLGPRLVG